MVFSERLCRIIVQNCCLITDFSFLSMMVNLLNYNIRYVWLTFYLIVLCYEHYCPDQNGFVVVVFREQFS